MGQKVNPNGLRVGISRNHSSRWYAPKEDIAKKLEEDIKIRRYLNEALIDGVVSHIDIERVGRSITIRTYLQFTGRILGRDEGKYIKSVEEKVGEIVNGHFTKKQLQNKKEGELIKVTLHLYTVENSALDATLVAKDIARQLEGRGTARVVQKRAIARVMKSGAKGIKTMVKGRVGGAEIARSESYREGVLSLHTLSSDIDYALAEAHTTYGILGCKVWISRPENYKQTQQRGNRDNRNSRNNNRENFKRNPAAKDGRGTRRTAPKAVEKGGE